jgi:hypothetical protein
MRAICLTDMQAAMSKWFNKEGTIPEIQDVMKKLMTAKQGAISESNAGNQDATQNSKTAGQIPGAAKTTSDYVTHDAVVEFLCTVFCCENSETILPQTDQKRLETLVEQFYFIGPVGERFFHWFFILGGADKQIIWDENAKTVKSLDDLELKNKVDIENVPFWRAMALVRDSLIQHLSLETKGGEDAADSGLYFAEKNMRKPESACNIPQGSASEIFTIEEIYKHAKNMFAHQFKSLSRLSLTEDLATAGSASSAPATATTDSQISQLFEQNIRGQLEFEWLITRPYSPCWTRHKKEEGKPLDIWGGCRSCLLGCCGRFSCLHVPHPTNAEGNQGGTNASSSSASQSGASTGSGQSQSLRQARKDVRRSSLVDCEIDLENLATFTRISDKSLGRNLDNVYWDWNESMWQSAVKAVHYARSPEAENVTMKKIALEQCDTIFYERTVDYQLNFTGENLFHL